MGPSDDSDSAANETSAELGRLAAEMLLKSPFLAMNPTLVPPTAAFAAATIVGFRLSTQLAAAFMGAMQGAMEVANQFAAGQEADVPAGPPSSNDSAPSAEAEQPVATREAVPPRKTAVPAEPASAVDATAPKQSGRKVVEGDDLKRISGIGPKLEQMLNGLGIRSVSQIAAWTDGDIKRIDAALGVDGRIARDDWVNQARKLTAKAVEVG
jgi:NADH-quinone oxidoreductase subunit E